MAGDSPNIAKSYIWNVEIMFLHILDMVKQTPTYKNKMKAFGLEHNQARTNKKKGSKNKDLVSPFWVSHEEKNAS